MANYLRGFAHAAGPGLGPELVGAILGHLGAILGPLGAILGPSWAILGPSWGLLGPSWGHLGVILKPLGVILGLLGPSWDFLGHLGAMLESKCIGQAEILILPKVCDCLWVHLGAILGSSWGLFRAAWVHLGAILGLLGQSWGILGHLGAILESTCIG